MCCTGGRTPAVNGSARRKEHWPQEDLQKGFKTMQLFRGMMRVNASDKTQAYVTLKGLTADIFVKVSLAGSVLQSMLLSVHRCLTCQLDLCTAQFAKSFVQMTLFNTVGAIL